MTLIDHLKLYAPYRLIIHQQKLAFIIILLFFFFNFFTYFLVPSGEGSS